MKEDVNNYCVDAEKINLACISYMFYRDLAFEYIVEDRDKLYSINEMIDRNGGDCEDYAMLFKATINGIEQRNRQLEAFKAGMGKYIVYQTGETIWYYEKAEPIQLGKLTDQKPYVAYYWTNIWETFKLGHCVIMFSKKEITTGDEINDVFLNDSLLVEPQNGQYLGKVGEEFTVCENGDMECIKKTNSIFFLITDDDLYQFIEGR